MSSWLRVSKISFEVLSSMALPFDERTLPFGVLATSSACSSCFRIFLIDEPPASLWCFG